MRRQHNILVGERTAEQIKIEVGAALPELDNPPEDFAVRGRDLDDGNSKGNYHYIFGSCPRLG